jgi:hypothetical protein
MPKRTLILVFIVAVSLNYLWELAQAPLYIGLENYNARVFWHCFVASLGDGIIVLLIVAAGWIILITAGFILAVVVEWVAVHNLGRWEYRRMMPKLPGLNIGLVPIVQMLVLPPIIFGIVASRKR